MTTNGKFRIAGLLCMALALTLDFYIDARYRFLIMNTPGTYTFLLAMLPRDWVEWQSIMTQLGQLSIPLLLSTAMPWRSIWPAIASALVAASVLCLAGGEAWHIAHASSDWERLEIDADVLFGNWLLQLVGAWLLGLPLALGGAIAWLVRKIPGTRAILPRK
jgi:hypothetical protein